MILLKFKLQRKALNQIYYSYLRPILEYLSVVWESYATYEKDYLEKTQYDAARLVTGLTRSVSLMIKQTYTGNARISYICSSLNADLY